MAHDSGADGPTFDEVLSKVGQQWEDLGRAIADIQRALDEVRSIHERVLNEVRSIHDRVQPTADVRRTDAA
jgi:prefoldin subunit 5